MSHVYVRYGGRDAFCLWMHLHGNVWMCVTHEEVAMLEKPDSWLDLSDWPSGWTNIA